jgi:acyl-CoA thioesterase
MSTTSPSFLEATQVRPLAGAGAGRYGASVPRAWDAPVFPSGGVMCAIALRAMEMEIAAPAQTLRSFATTFISTVHSGAVEVSVDRLRLGKRMSQLRADLRNAGAAEPGHVTTAAFGESREGFVFAYAAAPEVGPPDEYPGPADPPPGVPAFRARFFENIDVRRIRLFHSFESGWEGGRAEALRWVRYRNTPRLDDGRIDPLALIALADTMPAAVSQYVGPGYPFFHAPSVDLVMRFFADTEDDWFLIQSVCHWAGDGYASAEARLWDAHRKLVAHANQLMLVRFPEPQELGLG